MRTQARVSRRRFVQAKPAMFAALLTVSAAAGAYLVESVRAAEPAPPVFAGKLPITQLTENQAILHALNRLGFGPRPGDVGRVRQIGLENWIQQQLNPKTIDDSMVEQKLTKYETLKLTSAQLLEKYPQPQQVARRAGMTLEQLQQFREQLQQRRQNRRGAASPNGQMPPDEQMVGPANGPAEEMAGASSENGAPANVPQAMLDMLRPQRIVQELSLAKVTRAVYSERQLDEVMADFWFNHFNVFAGKGVDRWLLTSYERDTIRPHTLGKFQDLLMATAHSPAMLFYLDNWQSADPEAFERLRNEMQQRRQRMARRYGELGVDLPQQRDPAQRPRRGLNENYARELMELHTLGVEGGYTQKDVTEVARVLTGWTIRQPRRDPEFMFAQRLHDSGSKVVLGKTFRGGGIREGEQLLAMLAHHPSTAHFMSTKLAERFVSDNPPSALVDRMAAVFLKSDGDISSVLRTMIYSPEFWSKEAYRAKVKMPFELVVSAVRAVGFDNDVPPGILMWTARMGQPLYGCQQPNGYSTKAEAWVNTGALLNRMNFALQITSARPRYTQPAIQEVLGSTDTRNPDGLLARFVEVFLGGEMSAESRSVLESKIQTSDAADRPYQSTAQIAGLVLGSPEFQRH